MKELWPLNGHVIEDKLLEDDPDTGERRAASGLSGVQGWIADAPDGDPLTPELIVGLVERPLAKGQYYGAISGSTLNDALADLEDGTPLWQIIAYASEVLASLPMVLRQERYVQA